MNQRLRHHQRSHCPDHPPQSTCYRHGSSKLSADTSGETSPFNRTIVSTLSGPPPTRNLSPAHVTSISCLFPPSERVSTSLNCSRCISRRPRQTRSRRSTQPASPGIAGAATGPTLFNSICPSSCDTRISSPQAICLIIPLPHLFASCGRTFYPNRVNRRAIRWSSTSNSPQPNCTWPALTGTFSVAGERLSNTCPSFMFSRSRTLNRFMSTPVRIVTRSWANVSHDGCSSILIIHGVCGCHLDQIQAGRPDSLCTACCQFRSRHRSLHLSTISSTSFAGVLALH